MKKLLSLFLFFFFLFSATAQHRRTDSLWNIWKNANNNDTIKLNALQSIIETYLNSNPDTAFYLAKKQYDYALNKQLKKYEAQGLRGQGRALYIKNENTSAWDYFTKSLKISQEIKDNQAIAATFNDLGNIVLDQGNTDKALQYYLKALQIYEDAEDKTGIASSYMNIGNISYTQEDYKKAIENYFKSLKLSEESNFKSGIAGAYGNIGNVYSSLNDYKRAIEYNLKALKITEELGDQEGLIYSYNNIGDIFSRQQNFEKALEYFFKCETLSNKIGNKLGVMASHLNIGEVYIKQNHFEQAKEQLFSSLSLAQNLGYTEVIKENYSLLSELHQKKGDFKKAFEYHVLFSNIKDTLLNEESNKQITEMVAKYESEKKEKNIVLLTKDKELLTKDMALQEAELGKQKIFNYIFIGILLLAILLALILYNRYSINQKLNTALISKNEELSQKNILIENQKEKIIDNITYAKRIQQSILIDEKEIQSYLPNSFIFYLPKDIVSGDFYWCSKIGDDIVLAAIDCTGHGVSGAFMSMIGNTLLNQIVNEKHIITPSEILHLLNIGIFEGMNQGKEEGVIARDGMDMVICTINYKSNQLQFAGAQNALYLIDNNELKIIKGDMYSIGGGETNANPYNQTYTNHVIPINKKHIYLFTDGYMDQFGGPNRKKIGTQQFKELIINNQHLSMQKQKEQFISFYTNWKGKETQIDDVLLIGVQL